MNGQTLRWRAVIACCSILLCTTITRAEERQGYVLLSDDAYAALECSVFAAHARYNSEEKRLFAYGLKQAQLFIEAARAGRVSLEELNRANFVWPLVLRAWTFQPQDTSTDFVAGQVYQSIWENTTAALGKRSHDESTYQEPAREDFSSHNCSLLGNRD